MAFLDALKTSNGPLLKTYATQLYAFYHCAFQMLDIIEISLILEYNYCSSVDFSNFSNRNELINSYSNKGYYIGFEKLNERNYRVYHQESQVLHFLLFLSHLFFVNFQYLILSTVCFLQFSAFLEHI